MGHMFKMCVRIPKHTCTHTYNTHIEKEIKLHKFIIWVQVENIRYVSVFWTHFYMMKILTLWMICLICSWRKPMPHTWDPFTASPLPLCFCDSRTFLKYSLPEFRKHCSWNGSNSNKNKTILSKKVSIICQNSIQKTNGDWSLWSSKGENSRNWWVGTDNPVLASSRT